jgi:hypothetical protein
VVEYDWYAIVNGTDLQQGDFVFDLEVPIVRDTKQEKPPIDIDTLDAIVMTQSCDIPKKAIEHIVLCPVWDVKTATEFNPQFSNAGYLDRVKKNQVLGFYLLNKCDLPGYEHDYRLVQFERAIVMPKETVSELLSSRGSHLRLLPPYREQMAQRFGMFFARVASPKEIPSFSK